MIKILMAVLVAVGCLVALYLSGYLAIVMIALAVISCLVALYFLICLTIIKPNEFGVKVVLGAPGDQLTSGWHMAYRPVVKIIKITKELMMFQFTVESAVTGRGKIEGYEGVVEPIEIDIECTVYAQFDENKANEIIQFAPGYDAETLGPFLVPYAMDTVRALAGRIPWRLINRERYKSALWVNARLTGGEYNGIDDDDRDKKGVSFKVYDDPASKTTINPENLFGKSPFVTLHLKNVQFVIEDLVYTDEVKKSIVAPEKAILDGQATVIAAGASKNKKILEGDGDADAREKMIKAIKQSPELEALSALKEIGKGPSNFIFALPSKLQGFLENIPNLIRSKT